MTAVPEPGPGSRPCTPALAERLAREHPSSDLSAAVGRLAHLLAFAAVRAREARRPPAPRLVETAGVTARGDARPAG